MSARLARSLVASALVVACTAPQSGPAAAPPASAVTPSPPPSPSPSSPPPLGAIRFAVAAEGSLATIRVREQVAGVPAPGDAVLTTSGFSGVLILLADGSFSPGSTIAVDLDSLRSDSALRDEWIKINTLETKRFPRAEFRASTLDGVPLPLPASGRWDARLHGTMRIRDRERALTWDLTVVRSAGEVRASGATRFTFGHYGMAVPANRLILSVVDEIRLEIDVRARDA